jgi:putative acetyltransferase
MVLRAYRPEDRDAVIALIDGVYREYSDRVHLEKAEADLVDIPANYAPGQFMVLEVGGEIRATVAIGPDAERPEVCFLKRLYLDARLRGTGVGTQLLGWFLDTARGLGMRRVELWSDVRFERAHAFYRKHGFVNDGTVREMDDSWQPYREYFYTLDL